VNSTFYATQEEEEEIRDVTSEEQGGAVSDWLAWKLGDPEVPTELQCEMHRRRCSKLKEWRVIRTAF
jgi:hypothetical protein